MKDKEMISTGRPVESRSLKKATKLRFGLAVCSAHWPEHSDQDSLTI